MPPKGKSKGSSKKPSTKNHPPRDSKKDKRTTTTTTTTTTSSDDSDDNIFSATIPLTLQQLLLNVFKHALLYSHGGGGAGSGAGSGFGGATTSTTAKSGDDDVIVSTETTATAETATATAPEEEEEEEGKEKENPLNTKHLIQTIKSHLYNRDFDSAFADADEDLLRAYALRWSAARALGYAGLFRGLLGFYWGLNASSTSTSASASASEAEATSAGGDATAGVDKTAHVLCLGGGAGAEIVALAAAMRDWVDGVSSSSSSPPSGEGEKKEEKSAKRASLAVTAVDIADWSGVVRRLDSAVRDDAVPSGRSHAAPLVGMPQEQQQEGEEEKKKDEEENFQVRFRRADVLSIPDEQLKSLLHFNDTHPTTTTGQKKDEPTIITLMFTLNELFSTSMAKATSLLLRLTDLVQPGSLLLVVDSPGSYSTLRLARRTDNEGDGGDAPERRYPMKFLLDHTLLSVAGGKWERVYSRDSRWWRREASRLSYEVGEGAGLEDMRFQVHLYRRV